RTQQRALAWQGARAGAQQPDAIGEALEELREGKRAHASRGELEGERDAIELRAKVGDRRGERGIVVEMRTLQARPVEEELHRVRSRDRIRARLRLGKRQRGHGISLLSFDLERLAARREDREAGCREKEGACELGT